MHNTKKNDNLIRIDILYTCPTHDELIQILFCMVYAAMVFFFLSICVKIVYTECKSDINLQLNFIINRLLYYIYII